MNGKVTLNVNALKTLRMSRGLSQEALAHSCEQKRLRVSVATIKRAETGRTVNYRTVHELAKFFDVDIEVLISDSVPVPSQGHSPRQKENIPVVRNVLTVLWVRLEQRDEISALLTMLQASGSLWQEQIGSVLIATFGNMVQGQQGHLHGQRVLLSLRDYLMGKYGDTYRFYSMIHLGECTHHKGKTELSPETLQWFADYGTVVPAGRLLVNDELRHLSISHFRYERLGGCSEPLWLLGSALGNDQVLPLVGRSAELSRVMSLIEQDNQDGEPPFLAHITGSAGIGKTRLLGSVQENAWLQDMIVADVDFESGWSDSMELVTSRICRRFYENWDQDYDTDSARYLMKNDERDLDDALIISNLLGITPPTLNENDMWRLGATQDQARIVKVMADLLTRLAEVSGKNLLISMDNIHLASIPSFRLLGQVLKESTGIPLSFVMTSRSEVGVDDLINELPEDITITTVALGPLSSHEMEEMCDKYRQVDASYRRRCIEMADGVPLYLLQLLSNYSSKVDDVPASLQLIVEQKLLKLEKTDLRALDLLSACDAPLPIEVLSGLLEEPDYVPARLLSAQLVKRNIEQRISICHKLVQQVVYQRLGEDKRKDCHLALGGFLEQHHEHFSDAAPRLMARHFDIAQCFEKSSLYFYKTAMVLLKQGIYIEAQSYLDKALDAISRCERQSVNRLQVSVLLALSSIYKARYGWVSPLVKQIYERIIALCELYGFRQEQLIAMFGLWSIKLMTLELVDAEEMAKKCLRIAMENENYLGMMHANVALCNTLFWLGKHEDAVKAADSALCIYRQEFVVDSIEQLGFDPRSLVGCFGALSASLLKMNDRSEKFRTTMLEEASGLGHGFSYAIALQGAAWLDYHKRDYESMLSYARKLTEVAEENHFPFYQGVAALFIGLAMHKIHKSHDAADFIQESYHRWLATAGDKIAFSLYSCIVGEILRDNGEHVRALKVLAESIDFAQQHNEHCYLAELYRLSADVSQGERQREYLKKAQEYAEASPLFKQRLIESNCVA